MRRSRRNGQCVRVVSTPPRSTGTSRISSLLTLALAGDCTLELGNFPPFQQKLPRPARLMVEAVPMAVFGDVAVDQPDFLAFDVGIAFRDRALAVTERLHFGPRKLDAGFEPVLDEIIVPCAPVLGDDLLLVERLGKRLGHGS